MKKPKIAIQDKFQTLYDPRVPRGVRRTIEFLEKKENRYKVFVTSDLMEALGYSDSHFKSAIGRHSLIQPYRFRLAYHRYVWGNPSALKEAKEERGW